MSTTVRYVSVATALALAGACSGPQGPARESGSTGPGIDLRIRPAGGQAYQLRYRSTRLLRREGLVELSAEAAGRAPTQPRDGGPSLDLAVRTVRALRNGRVEEEHRPEDLAATLLLSQAGESRGLEIAGGPEAAHLPMRLLFAELVASRPVMPEPGIRRGGEWTDNRVFRGSGATLSIRFRHRVDGIDEDTVTVVTDGEVSCESGRCSTGSLEAEVTGRATLSRQDGLTGESTLSMTVTWLPPEDAYYARPQRLLALEQSLSITSGQAEAPSGETSLEAPAGPLAACQRSLVATRSVLEAMPLRADILWLDPVDLPRVPGGRLVVEYGSVLRFEGGEIFVGGEPWDGADYRLASLGDAFGRVQRASRGMPCAVAASEGAPPSDERPLVYVALPRELPAAAARDALEGLVVGARLALLVRPTAEEATPAVLPEGAAAPWRRVLAARSPHLATEAVNEDIQRLGEGCGAAVGVQRSPRECPSAAAESIRDSFLRARGRCACRARDPEGLEALTAAFLDARTWPWRWVPLPLTDDSAAPRLGLDEGATAEDLVRALAALPEETLEGGVRW